MLPELFHYTTRDFAEEVLRDLGDPGNYAEIGDGLYGPGFYALDLGPDTSTREELRRECFGDARPDHPMDGVLVIDPSLAVPPFEHQERHVWMAPGGRGSRQPIDHMVTAVGWWDGAWVIEQT